MKRLLTGLAALLFSAGLATASIYTLSSEPAVDAIAASDVFLVYDTSGKDTNKATGTQLLAFTGSGMVDSGTANFAITQAANAGQVLAINDAAGVTITLPAATGTGARYTFIVGTTVTSNAVIIQVADATDEFAGTVRQTDVDTSDTPANYPALAADNFDTITLNGTTTCGLIGDVFVLVDMATNLWALDGQCNASGSVATMLTAAVS